MRLTILFGVVLFLCSCAMPMRVRHVSDPGAEPEGVRYFLKRPSYDLVLNVPKNDDLKEIMTGGGCIRSRHKVSFKLKQEMKGAPEIYEISGPSFITGVANAFADTSLTATFSESGRLATVESSAEDKSLEFIAAVAELAIGAAKKVALPGTAENAAPSDDACLMFGDRGRITAYVSRRIGVSDRIGHIKTALNNSYAQLGSVSPKERKLLMEAIISLRAELLLAQKELKATAFSVHPQYYCLAIDGITLNPKTGLPKKGGDKVCLDDKKLLSLALQ